MKMASRRLLRGVPSPAFPRQDNVFQKYCQMMLKDVLSHTTHMFMHQFFSYISWSLVSQLFPWCWWVIAAKFFIWLDALLNTVWEIIGPHPQISKYFVGCPLQMSYTFICHQHYCCFNISFRRTACCSPFTTWFSFFTTFGRDFWGIMAESRCPFCHSTNNDNAPNEATPSFWVDHSTAVSMQNFCISLCEYSCTCLSISFLVNF